MTTHAVCTKQITRIANTAFNACAPWPICQPCINLPNLCVHPLADCQARILIGACLKQPNLQLISRRISLYAKVINFARLKCPANICTMRFLLLMGAFICIRPFTIFHHHQRPRCLRCFLCILINLITTNSMCDQWIRHA